MIAGQGRRSVDGREAHARGNDAARARATASALIAGAVALSAAGCRAPVVPPAPAGRVVISQPDIYRITAGDLADRLGWSNVDPAALRLSLRGQPMPVRVVRSGTTFALVFYGAGNPGPDSAENVYWLERASGGGSADDDRQPLGGDAAGGAGGAPDSFAETYPVAAGNGRIVLASVRAEVDAVYEPERRDGDPWLWRALPAPRTEVFTTTISALAPGPARLRVALWGSTEAAVSPDHRVRVAVNGRSIADETWDGRTGHVVDAVLAPGVLRSGVNAIAIEAPGAASVAVDIPIVDWIAVDHPRPATADDDRLAFTALPGASVALRGFSGVPSVWDVTDPARPKRVVDPQPAGAAASDRATTGSVAPQLVPAHAGHRYAAAAVDASLPPARIEPATLTPDLRTPGLGADWLAIGPADLLPPLDPLVERRREQGLAAMAVPLAAVFDQFGHGLAEPEGIRAFLRHARSEWRPAPRYVLLVGDATFDPRGHTGPATANRLPTFLVPTVFGGQTGSDVELAQLDGDPLPDLAIGRVPARVPRQVSIFVEKSIAHDDAPAAGWRYRVLAVADGQEASFARDAETFVAAGAPPYTGTVLTGAPGSTGAAAEIRAGVDAGVGVLAYFGHGSVGQWGKDRLFTTDDVPDLANAPRFPIMLNLTCLTGLFTHPTRDALVEAMLWHEGGGVVAALAPTSLTLAGDQSALSSALARGLTDGRHARLGDAVLEAWRAVPTDTPGGRDVVQTFLLFGDPGLPLR